MRAGHLYSKQAGIQALKDYRVDIVIIRHGGQIERYPHTAKCKDAVH